MFDKSILAECLEQCVRGLEGNGGKCVIITCPVIIFHIN
jgi:hypothetical protein